MSIRPRVSVVIVCHNDWPSLELAIESVLQQTLPPHEVIIVDNGSTDATASEIGRHYVGRVQYICQENLGAAGGRNTGLRAATGDYIQFVDGDDFLAPTKLAKQAAYLEEHPEVDLVYSRYRCFRDDMSVPAASLQDVDAQSAPDMRAALIDKCIGPPIVFLFRHAVMQQLGPMHEGLYNEDYEYQLRAAFAGCRFACLPEVTSFYRRRTGQKSDHRARIERSNLALFRHLLQHYDLPTPYRQMVASKLTKLRYSFAHYHLWRGHSRRALGCLRRAQRHCPPNLVLKHPTIVKTLARMLGGSVMYGMLRRWRGLPAPFGALPANTTA